MKLNSHRLIPFLRKLYGIPCIYAMFTPTSSLCFLRSFLVNLQKSGCRGLGCRLLGKIVYRKCTFLFPLFLSGNLYLLFKNSPLFSLFPPFSPCESLNSHCNNIRRKKQQIGGENSQGGTQLHVYARNGSQIKKQDWIFTLLFSYLYPNTLKPSAFPCPP